MFLFHLGKHPDISLREIEVCYPEFKLDRISKYFVLVADIFSHDVIDIQKQLGGTMYISKLIGKYDSLQLQDKMYEDIVNYIGDNYEEGKKINLACASNVRNKSISKLDFELKNILIEIGKKVRVVRARKGELSTAHIHHEKLTEKKGFCFWILNLEDRLYISSTVSVQNITRYSLRDYEKPMRDAKNGMLPAKLSQIMLNFSYPAKKVLDPFCGCGTVLLEGMEMNVKVDGSDIGEKFVKNTQQNVLWYKKYVNFDYNPNVFQADAKEIYEITSEKYDAIVTEGYLGPIYNFFPRKQDIDANFRMLEDLYLQFLYSSKQILKENGRIVITFPCYHGERDNVSFWNYFYSQIKGFEIIGKPLIYGRENQHVWREIVVLESL